MKNILILDAVLGSASAADLDDLIPPSAGVLKADHVPDRQRFNQIYVVDHGTLDCLTAAREALAYRRQRPNCRVRILRDVESECGEAEALIRAMAPRRDAESFGVAAAAVPELVRAEGQFNVSLSEGGVLFEYAA